MQKELKKIIIKAFFIALIVFICIIFIPKKFTAKIFEAVYFDNRAKTIGVLDDEQKKILKSLQEYTDNTNFSIEMNSDMVFPDGRSEGTMYISNPQNNFLNMWVDIYLNSTNQLVYKSGVLKPGDYIEKDSLRVFLKKGTYNATAIINAIEPDTNNLIGQIELDVVINVLE